MTTISLTPPSHRATPYPIVIGSGSLQELKRIVTEATPDRIVILHDERLKEVAANVSKMINGAASISVRSGEASKTLREVEKITEELQRLTCSRKSVVITIGGGMMTDLGGFIASIYLRGIRVIHIPTSTLAMVDAAVGGKTAVDLGTTKNILGTIHHPLAIIMDTDLLKKLPDTQFCEGLVEVVKMAAILDAASFDWMEGHLPKILKRDDQELTECIALAVRLKATVVEEDERDTGKRLFLNFGHTVGHAVEALSQFRIPHGQAVSVGMVCEMEMRKTEGRERVLALLQLMKMPIEIPKECIAEALWELMLRDKKSDASIVRMAVPVRIGSGEVCAIDQDAFFRIHPVS